MTVHPYRLAAALLAGAAPAATAQPAMKGMTPMPAAPHAKATTGQGTGVIRAVDQKGGTVTIQHGPIPAVGWPAMTMTFKARPASLLKSLKVGQGVRFDLSVKGYAAEVTAIHVR